MTEESHRQAPRPPARSLRRVPVQDRGRRRVEAILDAAAAVIADVGVDAASTNAIAARAGAAKGSLYQFFPSKDAIVAALATRYAAALQALHASTFPDAPRDVPLSRLIDGIVDPLAEFHDQNPAFRHVFNISPSRRGPATDTAVRKEWEALNRSIVARVVALLGALAPTMSEADRTRHALVVTTAGEALLALRDDTPRSRRAAVLADLKRLLLAYLAPLLAN
jgi:AcrR family transcriptional regulator